MHGERNHILIHGRSIALLVHDIMRGEKPETLSTTFIFDRQPTINMQTARAIGVSPDWYMLTEALLLNEKRTDIPRVLSLQRPPRKRWMHLTRLN